MLLLWIEEALVVESQLGVSCPADPLTEEEDICLSLHGNLMRMIAGVTVIVSSLSAASWGLGQNTLPLGLGQTLVRWSFEP